MNNDVHRIYLGKKVQISRTQIYNKMSKEIKQVEEYEPFKIKLKKFLIDKAYYLSKELVECETIG